MGSEKALKSGKFAARLPKIGCFFRHIPAKFLSQEYKYKSKKKKKKHKQMSKSSLRKLRGYPPINLQLNGKTTWKTRK